MSLVKGVRKKDVEHALLLDQSMGKLHTVPPTKRKNMWMSLVKDVRKKDVKKTLLLDQSVRKLCIVPHTRRKNM